MGVIFALLFLKSEKETSEPKTTSDTQNDSRVYSSKELFDPKTGRCIKRGTINVDGMLVELTPDSAVEVTANTKDVMRDNNSMNRGRRSAGHDHRTARVPNQLTSLDGYM